jgi:hypothetical protein
MLSFIEFAKRFSGMTSIIGFYIYLPNISTKILNRDNKIERGTKIINI